MRKPAKVNKQRHEVLTTEQKSNLQSDVWQQGTEHIMQTVMIEVEGKTEISLAEVVDHKRPKATRVKGRQSPPPDLGSLKLKYYQGIINTIHPSS